MGCRVAAGIALVAGCGFEARLDPGLAGDAAAIVDIAHVRAEDEAMLVAAAALVLGAVTIDTTALSISPSPGVVRFVAAPQDAADAPEIAILDARSVRFDGAVVVVGTRPLVVVADTIEVNAPLSSAATLATPGAGGALPGMGPGRGRDGQPAGDCDQGGAGGGFGTAGGAGGTPACSSNAAPAGGDAYGTPGLTVLQGGSGGGLGSQCGSGGAGGGALQLSARESMTIASTINVGGGGGGGGRSCATSVWAAGGGGGSGGAIYLQAPAIAGTGTLAANGGAGGGGSFAPDNGGDGGDGGASTAPAPGGTGANIAGSGGNGAAASAPAGGGTSPDANASNAGGGGGAVGRIVLSVPSTAVVSLTSSPDYVRTP